MSLKTSLYDSHVELGAKMVSFAGWQMPIQYNNLKNEVLAIRNEVGVFDVSHMGEFFVEGPDALKFVDYLVTNDINNAQVGKAVYSPLCNENGTIIDDLIVYKLSETFIMICVNAANIEKDFNWMSSKVESFNCSLTNKSDDFSLLALQGPKSFEVLSKSISDFEVKDIEYYSIQSEDNIYIARTGYTGEDGFEIFGPHDFINKLWKNLLDNGAMPCGLGSRDVLRLEVCYPLYGNELNDKVTPLDSALKWTVKFDKKGFIGKDALINYTPKFQLIKISLDKGIPRDGYPLEDENGTKIGEITSGTMSVILKKGIALARVDKSLYNPDQQIFVNIRGKQFPAKRQTKPFVSGGHK